MDDDLQNPPEEIPVLLEVLKSDPELDVVVGIPDEKKHAYWRGLGSDIVNAINSFSLKKATFASVLGLSCHAPAGS